MPLRLAMRHMVEDILAHDIGQGRSSDLRILIEAYKPAPRIGRIEHPVFRAEMTIELQDKLATLLGGDIQHLITQHNDTITVGAKMHRIGP